VVKLPADRWQDYIPKRPDPIAETEASDDDNNEVSQLSDTDDNYHGVSRAPAVEMEVIHVPDSVEAVSRESDSLLSGFNADEYSDVVPETQLELTESQWSTTHVFNEEETQDPNRL